MLYGNCSVHIMYLIYLYGGYIVCMERVLLLMVCYHIIPIQYLYVTSIVNTHYIYNENSLHYICSNEGNYRKL